MIIVYVYYFILYKINTIKSIIILMHLIIGQLFQMDTVGR